MPFYDIANLRVEIIDPKGRTKKQAIPYLSENQSSDSAPDIVINVDEQRVKSAMATRTHPGRLGIYDNGK